MIETAFDDLQDRFSEAQEGIWWRNLAGYGDYTETVYYSALSVVIFTLLLILIVEGVRRKLEFSAADRPLFKSVLEGVYRELATLGIVELVIHNIHVYGNDTLDAGKESLFIDVHFALFYTAIFNALQSVIIAIVATRFSREMWVHTEELELDHYVQIREEFDEVEKSLYGGHTGDLVQRIGSAICHPRLKARYNRLLVQVRFHQLRVHFLQAYDLPLQVKVSDYLMRTEKHVYEHLIHVSTAAWLWLTVLSNIIYYVLGISINETGDLETGGDVLSYVFFSSMVLFIVVTFLILWHMQATFEKILNMPHLWQVVEQSDDDEADNENNNALAEEQLNLFFGGDPHLLISITQYMQFGYAVALAMTVVFWNTLKEHDYFKPYYYLLSILVCYFLFLLVMVRVVPRYTMCTSLGQLVDRQRLNETVSLFKLEDAKRRDRIEPKDSPTHGKKHSDEHSIKEVTTKEVLLLPQQALSPQEVGHKSAMKYSLQDTNSETVHEDTTRRKSSSESSAVRFMRDYGNDSESDSTRDLNARLYLNKTNASTDSLSAMDLSISSSRRNLSSNSLDKLHGSSMSSLRKEKRNDSSNSLDKMSTSSSTAMSTKRAEMLANLVLLDTDSLRQVVSVEEDSRKIRKQRRKRYKSQSDGVALMRGMGMGLQPVQEGEKPIETVQEHHNETVFAPTMCEEPSTERDFSGGDASSGMNKLVPNDTEFSSTLEDDTNSEEEHVDADGHDDSLPSLSMFERFDEFLMGNKYKLVTHLMGSMFCFFLLGMRVETFDEKNGILPVEDNTLNFSLRTSFWMTFGWLMGFLFMSTGIIIMLCPCASWGKDSSMPSRKRKELLIASIFDVVLTALCLVLFLEAENLRCCDDESDESTTKKRVLEASYYDDPLVDGYGSSYYEKYYASTICSCHAFGERLNGGLGNMEPFVACLITLRSLRFLLARKLIKIVLPKKDISHEHHDGKKGHHGSDAHGGDEVDHSSAVKLWQATIAQHPDIVAEYGEFSGELLRAMLGVENSQQVIFQKFDSLSHKGSRTIRTIQSMADTKPTVETDEISL